MMIRTMKEELLKIMYAIAFVLFMIIKTCLCAQYEIGNLAKQKIIDAGCPFVSTNQLLERNVCLMPEYALNEMPKNFNGKTRVNSYLLHVYVLEVDEMKNQITIEILQYMDWKEPRIKANFSAAHNKNKIKILSKNFKRIWHPDLDIYTKRLKEWQSLYDPLLYREMYIRNEKNKTTVKLSALKEWKAKVSCKFDFSTFPFDTQICAFLQFGSSSELQLKTNCRNKPAELDNKPAGYNVFLTGGGAYCEQKGSNALKTSKDAKDMVWMDIGFNITLKRIIQPYLYQYYFPSIAIVVVSQISFMIPLSASPGRIALVVTQFLTLTNIFIHQASDGHSDGNLNQLDVYLLVSLLFVIATMVEFAVILLISRIAQKRNHITFAQNKTTNYILNDNKTKDMVKTNSVNNFEAPSTLVSENDVHANSEEHWYCTTDVIDFAAFFIFLFSYVIFNVAYMSYHM